MALLRSFSSPVGSGTGSGLGGSPIRTVRSATEWCRLTFSVTALRSASELAHRRMFRPIQLLAHISTNKQFDISVPKRFGVGRLSSILIPEKVKCSPCLSTFSTLSYRILKKQYLRGTLIAEFFSSSESEEIKHLDRTLYRGTVLDVTMRLK